MKKVSNIKRFWWLLLLLLVVVLNVLAGLFHQRLDLTEDKRYSLSQSTVNLLQRLESPLEITIFLTGELPAGFKRLGNGTTEFVSLLKETAPGKIKYIIVSPFDETLDGKRWSDSLNAMGAFPLNLTVQVEAGQQNKYVYPYALVSSVQGSELVSLYTGPTSLITNTEVNNAEAMMEYQFVKSIDKLVSPSKPFIAYAVGHGEPTGPETYDMVQTIRGSYEFFSVDLSAQPAIPDTMKVLLMVKPSRAFTNDEKLKIDQYLMRGGKLLFFIDNLHAEMDSLSYKDQLVAYDRNLNIDDLLFNYGLRINTDLLMDLQCDFLPFKVGGNEGATQDAFIHWNYYPLFASAGNHPINKNLGLVLGRFVNSIDTVETKNIQKTVLLQSSANSRTINTPALISPNEVRNTPEDALFKRQNIPAAVLLEGKFPSLYRGRVTQAQRDSLAPTGGFRGESGQDAKMIIAADGDLVLNDFSFKNNQPLPMGVNFYTVGSQYEYQFANRNFLMNCLEYLTAKQTIIAARNKEVILRLLDTRKVAEDRSKWQIINIALPIVIVLLFGALFQYLRRQKYTSG